MQVVRARDFRFPRVVASLVGSRISQAVSWSGNGKQLLSVGFLSEFSDFPQATVTSSSSFLDKSEVTHRVVDLLKSIPFIDPRKVNPSARLKDDLQLDTLDCVEVMMAAEEEFAVGIPDSEAGRISSVAHLVDYIATHPQAK